jgi:biopolymer transport protein ExbD
MTWKIRHEGSPRSIEGLKPQQVLQGLADGLWEATDEVMGPNDCKWVALEAHPQFAEAVADMEGPLVKPPDEETRLDMNPLIDVALVLLVFFILTTSYAALQKVLEMPAMSPQDPNANRLPTMKEEDIDKMMIRVALSQEGENTVYTVEGKQVSVDDLKTAIQQYVTPGKTDLAIEATPDVPWGGIMTVQDRARAAGIQRAHMLKREALSPK